MIKFLYPGYFFFLIPILIIILVYYFTSWKNVNFLPIEDLKSIFISNSIYYKIYYILIFIIFLLFISIFSKPIILDISEKNKKDGIDIQIVLDISYSMSTEDFKPNRLEVAKDVISNFLNRISSDRVWIIVFAWKTFTSIPLSFDYNIIEKIVDKISVKTIDQRYDGMDWTAIWDALVLASESFWNEKNREKIIILLTDWTSTKWLDPILASTYLNEKNNRNIKIYTIWIWKNEKSFITVKDNYWRNINLPVLWIDEDTLKIIANNSNWKYFRASDRKSFENIFNEISKLEKTEIEVDIIKSNREKYDYFIYLLILFFMFFIWIKYWKNNNF